MSRLVCNEDGDLVQFLSSTVRPLLVGGGAPPARVWVEVNGCDMGRLELLHAFCCGQHADQVFHLSLTFSELSPDSVAGVVELAHFAGGRVERLELDVERPECHPQVLDVFTRLLRSPAFTTRQIHPGKFGSRFQHTAEFFAALGRSQVTHLKIDVRGNLQAMYELMDILPTSTLQSFNVALYVHSMELFMKPVTMSLITELDMSDCEFADLAMQEFESELPVLQRLVGALGIGGAMEGTVSAIEATSGGTELALQFHEDANTHLMHYAMQLVWHIKKLKGLNFGGCGISTQGLICMFQPLKLQYCGLTSLDVSSNGMEDLALKELCLTLENGNCALERLVAYDNAFSMQAVEDYIFPMLRHQNCKLVGLKMVGEFGEDDDRLDDRRIDFEFSRLLFSRKLFVLSSAKRVPRVGHTSALRRLPNDLLRTMGTMLLPPVVLPGSVAVVVEEEEEEEGFNQV